MNRNLQRVWQDDAAVEEALQAYLRQTSWRRRLQARAQRHCKLLLWRVVVGTVLRLKRLLDLAIAGGAIVALSPVFLLAALAIKLEDRGPVLFAQTRVGLRGRTFRMLKFRSMVVNADQLQAQLQVHNESAAGVLFKIRNDPRITRVGRILRKLSIDELPQLFNVITGEMSVVGPRPALPREVALYSQDDRTRLEVKPGITCLWQIGGRSDIDFHGQVRLDLQYMREQSVWLDLWILLKTVPVVLLGKGAY